LPRLLSLPMVETALQQSGTACSHCMTWERHQRPVCEFMTTQSCWPLWNNPLQSSVSVAKADVVAKQSSLFFQKLAAACPGPLIHCTFRAAGPEKVMQRAQCCQQLRDVPGLKSAEMLLGCVQQRCFRLG